MPLAVAILAASSLVTIPPVPLWVPLPLAFSSSSGVIASISFINFTFFSARGSAEKKPSTSVKITNWSASTLLATSAESRSLSPNLISSTATVSFSFTTGTTPRLRSVNRVFLALRYLCRWARSSEVKRTCATRRLCFRKNFSYILIRWPCPILANACFSRIDPPCNFNLPMPAPIAPEVTMITSASELSSSATSSTILSMVTSLMTPEGLVKTAVPIFITILFFIF